MTDWTRDENGEFIDWTKSPYRKGSIVTLSRHEGEIISDVEFNKRIREYCKLSRRQLKIDAQNITPQPKPVERVNKPNRAEQSRAGKLAQAIRDDRSPPTNTK